MDGRVFIFPSPMVEFLSIYWKKLKQEMWKSAIVEHVITVLLITFS